MARVLITRIDLLRKQVQRKTDFVAQEKPFFVFLNQVHYATIFCSPRNLRELAIGHVLTEGIVKSVEEIRRIDLGRKDGICRLRLASRVDLEKRLGLAHRFTRVIFSACGSTKPYQPSAHLCRIKSDLRVKAEVIQDSFDQLNARAEVFRKTGGVHAAAIFGGGGNLVAFAEDIGRHNAVDKVVGIASSGRTDIGNCFLALTGRLSGDIVLKAARLCMPIVASLAAAIDTGIRIAKDARLTLVGFVRGKRMNIYTFPERIVS